MPDISVIILTLNEEANLPRCLGALSAFDDVWVVDSGSTDRTVEIATAHGAQIVDFQWNGQYPKKFQWAVENAPTKHDYIFLVDADEEVTPALVAEITALNFDCAGYYIKGRYVLQGQILRHGLVNNKLALFNKNKIAFPVINDLGGACMGEIEGHYQPVLKAEFAGEKIGQLAAALNHYAHEDMGGWARRHERYAKWEADMIAGDKYPKETSKARAALKQIFRHMPMRGAVAFLHCYIYKLGFLDGRVGFEFAVLRYRYYRMVSAVLSANKAAARHGGRRKERSAR